MGTFNVPLRVGHPAGGATEAVEAMVDTGATHTMLPGSLLAAVDVEPREYRRYVLRDGSEQVYGIGMALIALDNRDWPCPVVFGPDGQFLLGATTLEIFGLMVDPAGEELIPREIRVRPF